MVLTTQLLHLDSIYGTQIFDKNSSTGVASTPFNVSYSFNENFKNVKSIALMGAELPVGFGNIRTGSTDTFTILINNVSTSIVLLQKNYTTIASLIADLNIYLSLYSLGANLQNIVSTYSNNVIINSLSSSITSLKIVDTNFSKYILGLRSTDTFANSQIIASGLWNLNQDNYVSLYIPQISGGLGTVSGGGRATFKIPLNAISGQIYYYTANTFFEQVVNCQISNLTSIQCIILDRFNNSITPSSLDWSCSLLISYEA